MKLFLRFFFLSAVVILNLAEATHAQTKFQKIFGGIDSTQDGLDIKQTTDGGYIINARISQFAPPTPGLEDAYLLKTNSAGTLQWSKRHAGTSYEEGRSITQTTDGGYFYAGETRTWSAGGQPDFDLFATKTDAVGTIQWTHNFGDVWNDGAWAVEQTTDGGYMAFGMSSNVSTNGYTDYYLLKLSNAGTIQWSHTFGGTYFDFGYDAMQTNDGGYIMTGSSYSFGNGYSLYTIKADVNGNFQWGTAVNGFADDYSYGVTQTNDGGYIVAGGTTSYGSGNSDVLLVKMNSSGGVSWTSTYGGFQNECGFTVKQTSDGGYAVCGGTNSVGSGGYDLFLMKTNSAGTLQWTKTYGGSLDEGPSGGMFFLFANTDRDVSMVNTSDGGFAITSLANSFGGGHVYLVKTDANGNSGCNETNGPFIQTVPTPSVISGGSQTNPVQLTGNPVPVQTNPVSKDTNVCCVPPTALAGNDVTICQSASTTLTASGGISYLWNTGQTTSSVSVSPTITTSYIVTVTDSCGSDKDTVIVTVNSLPVANAGANATICPGDNVTLSGTGTGTYLWNPGGQTTSSISVSPTATTTYTFSVTNSCGTSSDTATVIISNSITASISGNLSLCSGNATTLTASGGNNYSWSNGATTNSISIIPSSSSTYSVIASSGSCADTVSVNITVNPTPSITIPSAIICSGTNATLAATVSSGTPAFTYAWLPGGQTTSAIIVNPTVTTVYSLQVVDANGCSASATTQVTVNPAPSPAVAGNTTLCVGDATTLTASGGIFYSWSTGATSSSINVNPSSTTTYTVVATNSNGCTASATVTVSVSSAPVASVSGTTNICQGQSATLTASGGGTYSWSNGNISSYIIVSSAGTYYVIASIGSCSDTASATVTIFPNPTATAASNVTISQGQSATLTATGGGTYLWSNGAIGATNVVTPLSSMWYCVTVTDANNCTDSSCVTVTVTPMECPEGIYVPNAFSPNNDNENDYFRIYLANIACVKYFKLMIYSRWGEKIFQTNDPGFLWDGSFPGTQQNSAVFTYYMYLRFENGDEVNKKGNVSLVR